MNSDQLRKADALAEQARALPAEDRGAFLDRAGAESEVRAAVEAALARDGSEAEPVSPTAREPTLDSLSGPPTEPVLRPRAPGPPQLRLDPPDKVGPYRLLGLLGRGGMGEVFEAYDERLDRTVALKRIHLHGAADADVRRQRFRREARSAARLSHPGIVAVYDLVEEGDEDWLVMERAEGRRLSTVLAEGAMDEARALRVARDVADALASAHGRGIVHRDLKSENVMLSAGDGRARLLDFGLAKAFAATADRTADATLTREGFMVGTARSMSPEQVRGDEVGPASDLFSLGVLLYECLTGSSPFHHSNPVVSAGRVESWRPPPIHELGSGFHPRTSALVDRLLAKAPEERPASADEVKEEIDGILAGLEAGPSPRRGALWRSLRRDRSLRPLAWLGAALLVVAAVAAWLHLAAPAPPSPLRVVVLEPELAGREDGVDDALLPAAVRSAVLQALLSLEGVEAVTPEGLEEALSGTESVVRELAADEVLDSRLDCRGGRCQLSLSRVAPAAGPDHEGTGRAADGGASRRGGGTTVWTERFEVPADDYRLLARAVSAHLAAAYPDHPSRGGATFADLPPGAYERYLRLSERLRGTASAGDPAILDEATALRREAPELLEAYLLEAEAARKAFHFSRRPEQLEHARKLLVSAVELAPRDLRIALQRFDLAVEAGELEEAAEILAGLEELAPSDADVLQRRASLAARQGNGEEALASMRRAAEIRPSFSKLYNLALMEYRQGELDAARGRLERLLQRAPRSVQARSLLAQFELVDGSLERAVELYGELAEDDGGVLEIGNLGMAQLFLGRYGEAVDSYRRVHAMEPDNPLVALNLADALLLDGRGDEAGDLYRSVVEAIPADVGRWQELTVRGQALAHLGRGREAAEAVQQALQLAPDNPQVAYEAAVVYALLGYDGPAQVNAERALRAGVGERWFSLPWFDGLEVGLNRPRRAPEAAAGSDPR